MCGRLRARRATIEAMDTERDFLGDELPWPAPGDRLFDERGDWHTNAQISPTTFGGAAGEYRHTADEIVAQLQGRQGFPDLVARPVVYLYRHYLELQLKDTLREARLYFNEDPATPGTHDLMALWRPLRQLIERRWNEGEDNGELDAVQSALAEFHAIDARGETFRYPTTRAGAPALPDALLINLASLRDGVAKIGGYLEATATALSEERAAADY